MRRLSIQGMLPKKSTAASKKTTVHETCQRMKLETDIETDKLKQDIDTWQKEFALLEISVTKIERAMRDVTFLKSTELHKAFVESQLKIQKINKNVEAQQKRLNKLQTDFDKKLLTPHSKGEFNSLSTDETGTLKQYMEDIQKSLTANKELLDGIVDQCQTYTRKLSVSEPVVHKICFADEIEEATQISEVLNARMEVLCQETSLFHSSPNPTQYDSKKIEQTVLSLYTAHRKGAQLLDQIQKNLHANEDPKLTDKKTGPNID